MEERGFVCYTGIPHHWKHCPDVVWLGFDKYSKNLYGYSCPKEVHYANGVIDFYAFKIIANSVEKFRSIVIENRRFCVCIQYERNLDAFVLFHMHPPSGCSFVQLLPLDGAATTTYVVDEENATLILPRLFSKSLSPFVYHDKKVEKLYTVITLCSVGDERNIGKPYLAELRLNKVLKTCRIIPFFFLRCFLSAGSSSEGVIYILQETTVSAFDVSTRDVRKVKVSSAPPDKSYCRKESRVWYGFSGRRNFIRFFAIKDNWSAYELKLERHLADFSFSTDSWAPVRPQPPFRCSFGITSNIQILTCENYSIVVIRQVFAESPLLYDFFYSFCNNRKPPLLKDLCVASILKRCYNGDKSSTFDFSIDMESGSLIKLFETIDLPFCIRKSYFGHYSSS